MTYTREQMLETLRKARSAPKSPSKTPWERLAENPKSMRAAINAKCCDCMGWGIDEPRPPGLMEDIRGCTSPRCPLYSFRPYK